MNLARKNSAQLNKDALLLEEISEYDQIITDLSRGKLKADFSLESRKSKLSYSLDEILFDEQNDELSYFVLFMDTQNASNYVKFLLDVKNFEKLCSDNKDNYTALDHNQSVAQDALSIFSKYLTQDARYGINLPSETIEAIIHSICPENYARIEENCFGAGKECVHRLLGEEFYEKYLISEYHCKYMLNILENRRLQLSDILYDDLAVVYFLEYLEQEKISDLLKFWIQGENFSRNILNFKKRNQLNPDQSFTVESLYNQWQSDAIIIYDNFISLQAKNKLGFDQFTRRSVESNICVQSNENEELDNFISSYSNSFYVPMLIVFNILDKVYFNKFISSALYKKFINEIRQSSEILNSKDCNSNIKPNKNEIKMNAKRKQSSQAKDEQLWSRPQSGHLQFGKVDSSGRYIGHDGSINVRSDLAKNRIFSDITNEYDADWNLDNFEEETTEKSSVEILEQKIKLKLEKFINMIPLNGVSTSSSKVTNEDVEIAEQMAEMLVRDVERDNRLV